MVVSVHVDFALNNSRLEPWRMSQLQLTNCSGT